MNGMQLVFLVLTPVITAASVVLCIRTFLVRCKIGYLALLILAVSIGCVDSIDYWNYKEEKKVAATSEEREDGPPPPGLAMILLFAVWILHREEKEANQAPLPTPVTVTPAADAPGAPATGAAEL
jgi:hypothetical protein